MTGSTQYSNLNEQQLLDLLNNCHTKMVDLKNEYDNVKTENNELKDKITKAEEEVSNLKLELAKYQVLKVENEKLRAISIYLPDNYPITERDQELNRLINHLMKMTKKNKMECRSIIFNQLTLCYNEHKDKCTDKYELHRMIMERLVWLCNKKTEYQNCMIKNYNNTIYNEGSRDKNIRLENNPILMMANFHAHTKGFLTGVFNGTKNNLSQHLYLVGSILPALMGNKDLLDDLYKYCNLSYGKCRKCMKYVYETRYNKSSPKCTCPQKDIDVAVICKDMKVFETLVDQLVEAIPKWNNCSTKLTVKKEKIERPSGTHKYKITISDGENRYPVLDVFWKNDIDRLVLGFHVSMVRGYVNDLVFGQSRTCRYANTTKINFDTRTYGTAISMDDNIKKYENRGYTFLSTNNVIPQYVEDKDIIGFITSYQDNKDMTKKDETKVVNTTAQPCLPIIEPTKLPNISQPQKTMGFDF